MENISSATSFILMAYTYLEDHRYFYSTCFLLMYLITLWANSVLIVVIHTEISLHKPMFLFICNLAVNELYGSTSLLPSILSHLLSHNYEISLRICLLQIFCIHLYGAVEFTILALMSYDRYIAICHPLHYHLLMSHRKACILISVSWIYPCVLFGSYFILTVQRTFCDRVIEKIYCSNFALVKLSCFETSVQSIVGIILTVAIIGPLLSMILFSYAQILRICLFTSKESQTKALQTCIPHLVAIITYSLGGFFDIIGSRFKMNHLSQKTRIFLSIFCLVINPMFNPLIYGFCIQTIRVQIHKLCFGQLSMMTKCKVTKTSS